MLDDFGFIDPMTSCSKKEDKPINVMRHKYTIQERINFWDNNISWIEMYASSIPAFAHYIIGNMTVEQAYSVYCDIDVHFAHRKFFLDEIDQNLLPEFFKEAIKNDQKYFDSGKRSKID